MKEMNKFSIDTACSTLDISFETGTVKSRQPFEYKQSSHNHDWIGKNIQCSAISWIEWDNKQLPDKVVFDDAFAIGQRVAILDVNCKNKDGESELEKAMVLINISTQRAYHNAETESPQFGESYIPDLSERRWTGMKDFSVQSESSRGYSFARKFGLAGGALFTALYYLNTRHPKTIEMIVSFVGVGVITYFIGVLLGVAMGLFGKTAKYNHEFDLKFREIVDKTISITNSTQTA